jgi:phage terminase Nu1 subunit (DNA packaging protein)
MTTNNIYRSILVSMPQGIEKRIMEVMVRHVGKDNRIKRGNLVLSVFGQFDQKAKQVSTLDRQTRRAIACMQERGIPILSDSNEGGYWLGTREECLEFIKEQQNRQAALARKISGIKKTWKIDLSELQPQLFPKVMK